MKTSLNTYKPVKHITAQEIHKNRLNVCKKLIEHDAFDLDVYASYFEIPRHQAEEDLRLQGYDPEMIKCYNVISLNKLIAQRNKTLEGRESDKETLAKLGYWHQPTNNYRATYHFNDLDSDMRFQDAVTYYQNERAFKKHAFSYVAELFSIPVSKFIDYVRNNNIERYEHKIVNEHRDELYDLLRYSKVVDVSKLIDVPAAKLYPIAQEISKTYMEEKSDLIGSHKPSPRAHILEERRRQVWEMYTKYGSTHGMTQLEIANELGLTRRTVISDIKAYKKEHPEVIDATQIYQPHHLGENKTIERMEKVKISVDLYQQGFSLNDISKTVHSLPTTVKQYLIEEGVIDPYSQVSSDYQNRITHRSQKGYEFKGQFTTKEITHENIVTAYHGTTSHLLEEAQAPLYSTDMKTRNMIRNPILQDQRNTMAVLRNNPEAYREFMERRGNIQEFLSQKEPSKEKDEDELEISV